MTTRDLACFWGLMILLALAGLALVGMTGPDSTMLPSEEPRR